ncbi:hypothetical protein RUND412_010007 [Rhizina undulata]
MDEQNSSFFTVASVRAEVPTTSPAVSPYNVAALTASQTAAMNQSASISAQTAIPKANGTSLEYLLSRNLNSFSLSITPTKADASDNQSEQVSNASSPTADNFAVNELEISLCNTDKSDPKTLNASESKQDQSGLGKYDEFKKFYQMAIFTKENTPEIAHRENAIVECVGVQQTENAIVTVKDADKFKFGSTFTGKCDILSFVKFFNRRLHFAPYPIAYVQLPDTAVNNYESSASFFANFPGSKDTPTFGLSNKENNQFNKSLTDNTMDTGNGTSDTVSGTEKSVFEAMKLSYNHCSVSSASSGTPEGKCSEMDSCLDTAPGIMDDSDSSREIEALGFQWVGDRPIPMIFPPKPSTTKRIIRNASPAREVNVVPTERPGKKPFKKVMPQLQKITKINFPDDFTLNEDPRFDGYCHKWLYSPTLCTRANCYYKHDYPPEIAKKFGFISFFATKDGREVKDLSELESITKHPDMSPKCLNKLCSEWAEHNRCRFREQCWYLHNVRVVKDGKWIVRDTRDLPWGTYKTLKRLSPYELKHLGDGSHLSLEPNPEDAKATAIARRGTFIAGVKRELKEVTGTKQNNTVATQRNIRRRVDYLEPPKIPGPKVEQSINAIASNFKDPELDGKLTKLTETATDSKSILESNVVPAHQTEFEAMEMHVEAARKHAGLQITSTQPKDEYQHAVPYNYWGFGKSKPDTFDFWGTKPGEFTSESDNLKEPSQDVTTTAAVEEDLILDFEGAGTKDVFDKNEANFPEGILIEF